MGNKNSKKQKSGFIKKGENNLYNFKMPSQHNYVQDYIITKPYHLYIQKELSQVYFKPYSKNNKNTRQFGHIQIALTNNQYSIEVNRNNHKVKNHQLWIRITQKRQSIQKNDTFKIGNNVIKVSQLHVCNQKQQVEQNQLLNDIDNNNLNSQSLRFTQSIRPSFKETVKQCRICLSKESVLNPFALEICACSDQNPIHLKCLLDWIKEKVKKQRVKDQVVFYDYQDIKCDLCQDNYPRHLFYKGNQEQVFQVKQNPNQNFIVLDFYDEQNENLLSQYYLALQDNQQASVGSSENSVILLKSQSVSKTHSKIGFSQNEFWIVDFNSTYGTLKLLPDSFKITKKQNQIFVMNKFAFEFHVLRNTTQCSCKLKLKNTQINPDTQHKIFDDEDDKEEEELIEKQNVFYESSQVEKQKQNKIEDFPQIFIKENRSDNQLSLYSQQNSKSDFSQQQSQKLLNFSNSKILSQKTSNLKFDRSDFSISQKFVFKQFKKTKILYCFFFLMKVNLIWNVFKIKLVIIII